MKRVLLALVATVTLAGLGGCMVVPVHDGYGYGYVEPRVSVVVPYGHYERGYRDHRRHPYYRGGPRGGW